MTQRCNWVSSEALAHYHDTEWGVPSRDDQHLFEMLVLEGAQAGLSWSTILNKREAAIAARSPTSTSTRWRASPEDVDTLVLDESASCAIAARSRRPLPTRAPCSRSRPNTARSRISSGRSSIRRRSRTTGRRITACACDHDRNFRRAQQGAQALRLQVRRLDDLLCVHAGGRHGQRPPDQLATAALAARRSPGLNGTLTGKRLPADPLRIEKYAAQAQHNATAMQTATWPLSKLTPPFGIPFAR